MVFICIGFPAFSLSMVVPCNTQSLLRAALEGHMVELLVHLLQNSSLTLPEQGRLALHSMPPSEILSSPGLSVPVPSSFSPAVSFPTLRVKRLNSVRAPHPRLALHTHESPYVPLNKMKLILNSRVNKEKQVNLEGKGGYLLNKYS